MAEGIGYAEPARESPLLGELAELHAQIDRLEHQASRLRNKLEPVMSPKVSPESENAPALRAANSQVNVEVVRANRRIVSIVDLITQTLDELEV